jgi:hypothetical protein
MEDASTVSVTERIHKFMDRKLEVYPELRDIEPKKAAGQTIREPQTSFMHIGALYFPIRLY